MIPHGCLCLRLRLRGCRLRPLHILYTLPLHRSLDASPTLQQIEKRRGDKVCYNVLQRRPTPAGRCEIGGLVTLQNIVTHRIAKPSSSHTLQMTPPLLTPCRLSHCAANKS